MNRDEAISTLCGLGRARYAPGTIASLAALLPAALLFRLIGPIGLFAAGLAAFWIGVRTCDRYAQQSGKHDPSECVIDELAGQWIACALAPFSLAGFAVAFVLFRLFDVFKPWPVSRGEKFPGGLGIMADDMIAGLLAGMLTWLASSHGLL